MEFDFFPIDISYGMVSQRAVIYLFGRTLNNEQICVVDYDFEPYFYAQPADPDAKEILIGSIKETTVIEDDRTYFVKRVDVVKKFLNKEEIDVLKIVCNTQRGQTLISENLKMNKNIKEVFEADIKIVERYMFDKNIKPFVLTHVIGERTTQWVKIKDVIKASSIVQESSDIFDSPNVLAFNIETFDPVESFLHEAEFPIMMISFYSQRYKRVISSKKFENNKDYVEFVETEKDLLIRFKDVIENVSPDILVGYGSDSHDLRYIAARAKKHNLKLDLGLNHFELNISKNMVDMHGIVHIDLFRFIKTIMGPIIRSQNYDLNNIARELVNRDVKEKNIDEKDLSQISEYSLFYSSLILAVYERVFPEIIELIKITGVRASIVTRTLFREALEYNIMRFAIESDIIVPNKPDYKTVIMRKKDMIKSQEIFEPRLGFYKNIAALDFKSFYPTIISVYNLSPENINAECLPEKRIILPNDPKIYFCRDTKGFFPKIVETLITRKFRVAEILKTKEDKFLLARFYCIKNILSKFYYYFSYSGSRWYSREITQAMDYFGKIHMKKVIDNSAKYNFEHLMSDSQMMYFNVGKIKEDMIRNFVEDLSGVLPDLLEVEFVGLYEKGLFVVIKDDNKIKKNFALLSKDKVIMRGFDGVLRVTCQLTHIIQEQVVSAILKEENVNLAVMCIREMIQKVKDNKIPLSNFVISAKLLKELDKYETTPPYVAAAKRMLSFGHRLSIGSVIEYIIIKGEGKLNERARLPNEVSLSNIDADYYIEKQIIPSVSHILDLFGISKEDILELQDQSKLNEYL